MAKTCKHQRYPRGPVFYPVPPTPCGKPTAPGCGAFCRKHASAHGIIPPPLPCRQCGGEGYLRLTPGPCPVCGGTGIPTLKEI